MTYNVRYCQTCEELVAVEGNMQGHTVLVGEFPYFEVDFCYGPFYTSEPPVAFEDDWDLNVVEPSPEELAIMSVNAEMLMQELE